MSDFISIGGLWKGKDKNGNEYWSGDFSAFTKIWIFKNTDKKNPNGPDFTMSISEKKKKGEAGTSNDPNDDVPF